MNTPNSSISLFWYRRLCEGTILLGSLILVFFGVGKIFNSSVLILLFPVPAVVMAFLATLVGLAGRWAVPFDKKRTLLMTWAVFLVNAFTTLTLILSTGSVGSPFAALWLLTALMSGVLGIYGLTLIMSTTLMYVMLALLMRWWVGSPEQLATVFFVSLLPIGVSFLLWRSRVFHDIHHDEVVTNLSEKLDTETSKSEIIVNAIADGVVVIGQQGVIELINPAGQQITGWQGGEAVQLDYRSVLKLTTVQDQPIQGQDSIQKVFSTGKTEVNNDVTLTTHEGKKVLLSLVASPISSEAAVVGVIAVFRDITEERAEEREKAEFISTASHEMRTPVAAIEGYLALAMNAQVATIDDKARSYLLKAHESTQHLGRLFQDLLTISRAEDGRLINNPKVIEIVAFVQKLWEAQQPKAMAKNLAYNFMPQQGHTAETSKVINPLFYANIDPDRLSEVLGNLIDNAIKYTGEGVVSVDVTADNDHITIGITDSGIGIPKEDIPHLFQKFYRVDNSYTREVGGTGLGLYISRRIMEQSSGQIWVESEVGKGSTFFVQIPRLANEKAALLQRQPNVATLSTPTPLPAASPLQQPVQPTANAAQTIQT